MRGSKGFTIVMTGSDGDLGLGLFTIWLPWRKGKGHGLTSHGS
jgi:hypothetical protein